MAIKTTTILQSLTRANPKTYQCNVQPSLTSNDVWLPIEGVRDWEDFTFPILKAKYKEHLRKEVPDWELNDVIKRCRLDEIALEDSVVAFSVVNSMLPIGYALNKVNKKFILGAASNFKMVGQDNPDWGCGWVDKETLYRENFCPGDFKCGSKWKMNQELRSLDGATYQNIPRLTRLAQPLESMS